MGALRTALPLLWLLAGLPAHAEDPVAALGKQSAAASRLEWEIGEAGHPTLGPVRFAHLKGAVATPVGERTVISSAYVSCEKSARTIAIELTNQTAPDDPGGLPPAAMPRLVCNSLTPTGDMQRVAWDIEARWQVNDLGDALARGLRPSALRACASIVIEQDVTLPPGWARKSAPVELVISPYAREVDAIFATCGEASAYPPAASRPASAPQAPAAGGDWKTARTVTSGKTNVRAEPRLRARTVVRLDPGAVILVRHAEGPWWRAKSRHGWNWEGYVREDRLVVPPDRRR